MPVDPSRALEVAQAAVRAAAEASLPHFERGVRVETKPDRSPVTEADREAEGRILEVIRDAFPDHGILAEESGESPGDGEHRWIVDPIDGTRGFTRGGQFWGALVGFEANGEIVAGAMGLPARGEVYGAAKGQGCWLNDRRLTIRTDVERIEDATLSLGEMGPLFSPPHGDAVLDLVRDAASARGYGDLMGCAMVLLGLADVWLEAGVKVWDIAPTKILLEEAGGRFTSFSGASSVEEGTAVGSHGRLHDAVLERLTPR